MYKMAVIFHFWLNTLIYIWNHVNHCFILDSLLCCRDTKVQKRSLSKYLRIWLYCTLVTNINCVLVCVHSDPCWHRGGKRRLWPRNMSTLHWQTAGGENFSPQRVYIHPVQLVCLQRWWILGQCVLWGTLTRLIIRQTHCQQRHAAISRVSWQTKLN